LAKFFSLIIIFSLLANTTPAAPSVMWASVTEFGQDVRYAYLTSPTLAYLSQIDLTDNFIFAFFFNSKNKQQAIAKIEISPNGAVIREGEEIALTAVASDGRGSPIQGVSFNWTAVDTRGKSPVLKLQNGFFQPTNSGVFEVMAEAGGVSSKTAVVVRKDSHLKAIREADERGKYQRGEMQSRSNKARALSPEVNDLLGRPLPAPVNNSTRMNEQELKQLDNWDKTDKQRQDPLKRTPTSQPAGDGAEENNGGNSEPSEKIGGPKIAEDSSDSAAEKSASNLVGGTFDLIETSTKKAKGTANGSGNPYGVNLISAYIDGPMGSGTNLGYLTNCTNQYGNCNWEFVIPSQYYDGVQHTLYVYSSNIYYQATHLSGSPKTFIFTNSPDPNWNNGNFPTADDPGVQPGNPSNTGTDGAGSSNFSFSAPVLSLGGRGMDVNLSLNYNSLLWHKAGNVITYDIDKGNPAPGLEYRVWQTDGYGHARRGDAGGFGRDSPQLRRGHSSRIYFGVFDLLREND
jgi:hypothetical protein